MRAVKYFVNDRICIEDRDPENRFPMKDTWAITDPFGRCLNGDLEFEYEPMPSNRNDAFLARCRFSLEKAQRVAATFSDSTEDTET